MSRPSAASLDALERSASWLRMLTRPVFRGWENIPDRRPLIFVGNHTMYGVIDAPQLFFAVYRNKDILLRGVGEKAHFAVPGWRALLDYFGVVNGTPENAMALLGEGECLLLYPGGAREAFKGNDQRYQLLWGDRVGFARLALRARAAIVPFAAVGADDVFDVVADQDDLLASPLGNLLSGLRRDVIVPIPWGQGPLGLPGIRRQYFQFQPAILPESFADLSEDAAALAVRQQAEQAVRAGLDELLAFREADPEADWKVALRKKLGV